MPARRAMPWSLPEEGTRDRRTGSLCGRPFRRSFQQVEQQGEDQGQRKGQGQRQGVSSSLGSCCGQTVCNLVNSSFSLLNYLLQFLWSVVRWRDLLNFALREDSLATASDPGQTDSSASNGSNGNARHSHSNSVNVAVAVAVAGSVSPKARQPPAAPIPRHRPLLLYFPHHGQLRYLGAYRTIILAERYCNLP